jgi:hypothetical protein
MNAEVKRGKTSPLFEPPACSCVAFVIPPSMSFGPSSSGAMFGAEMSRTFHTEAIKLSHSADLLRA